MSIIDIPGIRESVPLKGFTTWKTGGEARYFWEPTRELLPEILRYCYNHDIKVYFLGRGSNVLIPDEGLDGLVICTKKALLNLKKEGQFILAEAGVPMPKLSKFASTLGYGGYEYLIGIPGCVGGGITMNAGLTANGRKEIKDVLVEVEIINQLGEVSVEKVDQLDLDYRSSNIDKRNIFVLSAKFNYTYTSSIEEIRAKTNEHLKERRRKQPLSKPTAGSTFKQPKGGKPAGWYIEQSGLKGHAIGGALISEKHANWIVNTGDASSKDIRDLISYVQEIVYKKFSVLLEAEVKFLQ